MNILITGASGLIGRALTRELGELGHQVYAMSRRDDMAAFYWQETQPQHWEIRWDESINIDAVVHLAGESIGSMRWSAAKKQRIYDSRIDTTRALVNHLQHLQTPPQVLLSASAIGFYGEGGESDKDENSAPGDDFLANLAQEWERLANQASVAGIRVLNLRTGLVLSAQGGALATMLPPFKMGVGGRLGSGQQWMSWISLDDMVAALVFLLNHPDAHGPVNLVSPQPIRNIELTKVLAQTLKRPALCHMPTFAVKALFGEMGELLLLSSIRVRPTRLQALGYTFQDGDFTAALQASLQTP
ncbi:MAG: TIGR01777 family protein [Gammaproteobacteria bacterium]|nr:MAG: TIGR01777 family protein [Gammaproteobacteria bacterium]